MIERSRIFAVGLDTSKEDLLKLINDKQNTRIPVYEKNLDSIIGFIHIKDILKNIDRDFVIKDILRNIIFIPPSTKVSDLLFKMKSKHIHAAMVVDEFGGTEGLVTMIDIIEEIVGDIYDEHDEKVSYKPVKIEKDKFEVSGNVTLEDFNSESEIQLETNKNFRTIGGYIFHLVEGVPRINEKIIDKSNNVEILIIDADNKKINSAIIDISKHKID